MFSFVSCLSGLVVITVMFTNRVYIAIMKRNEENYNVEIRTEM